MNTFIASVLGMLALHCLMQTMKICSKTQLGIMLGITLIVLFFV